MRKRRAILYDDDAIVLGLLNDFFTLRGYDALMYRKPMFCPLYGDDADCNNLDPCADIVISDFSMPGQTGVDMLSVQSRRGCRVPAENRAIMSGYLEEDEHLRLKKLGGRFFQKPFLFSEISAWLDEREPHMDLSRPLGILRREKRSSCNEVVTCRPPRSERVLTGVAVNTSTSGLCLKLDESFPRGQVLTILPGPLPASRNASIRWVRDAGDGRYLTGLQYV